MASPGGRDELRDPADGPADRARRQAPDLGDVAIERCAVDAELVELLVEQVVRDAVEEQVDGEDDDDEVVEAAEERDVVGDQVPAEDEVAGGAGQQRLARRRRPLVDRERRDEPGVQRGPGSRAAGTPAAPGRGRRSCQRRWPVPSPSSSSCRSSRPSAIPVRLLDRGARAREPESTSVRAPRRHGGPRRARLDIERPFGIMHGKEARVTKHDAERKVKILDFIAATLRARGYPPSVREIARAVGLASTSAVHHHLQILEREGYLERGAAQSRAIRLTPTAAIRLGLSSELVPAGDDRGGARRCRSSARSPPAVRSRPTRTRRRRWPSRTCWRPAATPTSCKVRGDSMIEAHIADGDFVLIRPADHGPQRRHRRRPGRGERRHPQALLQGEGPDPPPAGQPGLPAAVLRRRPDPGQADRRHPQARLTAVPRTRRCAALVGSASRSRTFRCARSRARAPPSPRPPAHPILGGRRRSSTAFPHATGGRDEFVDGVRG